MPKVLLIGANFFPEKVGIGKYSGEFCEHLSALGFEVAAITGYPYYPDWKYNGVDNPYFFKKENVCGTEIWRCPSFIPKPQFFFQRFFQDFSFFCSSLMIATFLLFRKKRADIVFVVSPSLLNGLVGLWYKLWNPRAIMIYHVQDLQIDAATELGMIKHQKLISFLKKIEYFILSGSDIVSTISPGMMRKIASKSVNLKKILLFPNWVDGQKIFTTEVPYAFYNQFQLPIDKKIVLYSGSCGEKQGLDIILKIAHHISNDYPDIHFVISSSGPYAKILEEKSIEQKLSNVQFLPLLDTKTYNYLLNCAYLHLVIQKDAAADLVMPSKLTAILGVGGAAIVTANQGTSLYNLIYENEMGYLVKPDNFDTLLYAIKFLYSNPGFIDKMKSNSFRYSAQFLQKQKVILNFLESLEYYNYEIADLIFDVNSI
jgi:colanic acid biosynthesis glycosyl transferase WcaI